LTGSARPSPVGNAGASPFDQWYFGGRADALTGEQVRGFEIFNGKGTCTSCHLIGERSALFTDQGFHNTGAGNRTGKQSGGKVRVEIAPGVHVMVEAAVVESVGVPREADSGRLEVTDRPEDLHRFKTPSLRNVALTAPYMHDGSLPTLLSVVEFYDRGGVPHDGIDPLIRPLELSVAEKAALVAFLEALTSGNVADLVKDARAVPVGNRR
jgi:cytochrome c peroxidase